jgi:hypothetical protein
MTTMTINTQLLEERAAWLEQALSDLPAAEKSGDWKVDVLQSQARRDAEYSIAATLQSMQPGRAMITVSDRTGTSIRMLGLRAASPGGFEMACRCWIKIARARAQH